MEFDYIVVGAGSAGCVLADRLSEKPNTTVLLIEAGGSDRRFWIKVPAGYGSTYADPRVNWRYTAEKDPGKNDQAAYWPRGKVIGGSSSINAMAYVRGLAHDFDDWENAGATGWNWASARTTYERLERVCEPAPDGKDRLRGDGPVWVSDLRQHMHPFTDHFLAAARELGWPVIEDMNGPADEGLTYYRSAVRRGVRYSAADAFLRPALKRGTVKLVTKALVERVDIVDGRAVGVAYRVGGTQVRAAARREVILSGGAINSPQLLQLSGIGPAAHLQSLGIDVVKNLPEVGRGLQDHLALTHQFTANLPTLNAVLGNWLGRLWAGVQYLGTRKGPLSVPVNQVGGFVRSQQAMAAPDMQIYCNPISYAFDSRGKPRVEGRTGYSLCVQPCRPTSRGDIRIASPDPAVPPSIQPNSLATEKDRNDAVTASKLLKALAMTKTLAGVTANRDAPDITAMDDAQMLENFRVRSNTNYHPTCTCRMGTNETDSVLDERLSVHGLRGLRVVDASAFPNITSGNTNAPTMMLAMRAADLILEDATTASDPKPTSKRHQ